MFEEVRLKFTLWYLAILTGVLGIFSGLLYLNVSRNVYEDLDMALSSTARLINGIIETTIDPETPLDAGEILALKVKLDELPNTYVQVLDSSGSVLFKSSNLRFDKLPVDQEAIKKDFVAFSTIPAWKKIPLRMLTFPVKNDSNGKFQFIGFIQVAVSTKDVKSALFWLRFWMAVQIPMILALSSFGGLFLTKRALQPVDQMVQTALEIEADQLSRRIEVKNSRSELGRLAAAFNEMFSRLEESFINMRQFTADVSHELRTPLTIIKGNIQVALTREREAKEYQRVLETIVDEVNRLVRLIDDLLMLARGDSKNLTMNFTRFSMNELLKEVAEVAEIMASERGIKVRCNIEEESYFFGDKSHLRQLFLNLIDNAVKYNRPNGEIDISLSLIDQYVEIKITDSGIGIPKDEQEKIFERFYRVKFSHLKDQGGSGLGLSVCRAIAMAHRGEIFVESAPNQGSKFVVRLPKKV